MNSKIIKVGYVDNNYATERNIFGNSNNNVIFKRKYDLSLIYRISRRLPFIGGIMWDPFYNKHYPIYSRDIDLYHLFNRISFGKTPWITTYETSLPRYSNNIDKGLKALSSKYCKKIIALSQNAYDIQIARLSELLYDSDDIINKILVLHPPQELYVKSWEDKGVNVEDNLKIVMVGHLFYTKGGKEMLIAIDKLIEKGYEIKFFIVSMLQEDTYAAKPSKDDVMLVKKLINRHSDRIQYIPRLSNIQVIELLKKSHLALLCSYAETYGYFVLEAQATGTPVITTDIRAFPETNNNEIGWIINVPKDDIGYAKINTKKDRDIFSDIVTDSLYNYIINITENTNQIKIKGENSLKKILSKNNKINYSNILFSIYKNSLGEIRKELFPS